MVLVKKTVGRGWMFLKIFRSARGALYKLAPAVWADTIKIILSAAFAENSFKAANTHIVAFGTKRKANASRQKAISYKRMLESETKLRAQIDELLGRADAAERNEPELDIPTEIKRREARLETIARL